MLKSLSSVVAAESDSVLAEVIGELLAWQRGRILAETGAALSFYGNVLREMGFETDEEAGAPDLRMMENAVLVEVAGRWMARVDGSESRGCLDAQAVSDDAVDSVMRSVPQLPQLPQRQDSTLDQLRTVRAMANRLGCYDAADLMRTMIEKG